MYYTMLFIILQVLSLLLYLCYLYYGDNMSKIKNCFKTDNLVRSILVFLIFYFSRYFMLIPVKIFHINTHSISDKTQVYLSTFANIMLLIILIIIYQKDLKKEFKIFKKNFVDCVDIGVRWWLLGLLLMIASNFIITHLLHGNGAGNEKQVQSLLKAVPWLMFLDAGFIAPFNEEITFRKTIKDVITNKWLLTFVSFLLFGGAHIIGNINTFTDILYIIPYGSLGAVFALAYYESNTIFTTISMHMFHNAILVLLAILIL